jgi:phage gpG-like protein
VTVRTENLQLVIREIGTLPDRAMQAAAKGLSAGLQYAVGLAQRKYLSGPRPQRLGVVTARLRNSLTSRVDVFPDRLVGRIGTNVPYGAFHEFGFHGSVNVRAHTRTVAEFIETTHGIASVDSRRAIRERGQIIGYRGGRTGRAVPIRSQGAIVGYKETRTQSSARAKTRGITQQVKAHVRRLNYGGRPFVRPALKEALPRIATAIRNAIAQALKG